MMLSTMRLTIAGKGKLGQNIAEWVVVEIYFVKRSGSTVLDDPIAIVKG